jgi:isoquinoline 1-oxidoreductase beta subunit
MNLFLTRRDLLKKSLTGAGLTLVASLTPEGCQILKTEDLLKDPVASCNLSLWIRVTPENLVTIVVNKSEMGQGVYTSLPMIAADELEADWKQLRFEPAPAADQYNDPVWGRQLTGGSTSIRHMFEPMRKAGAAGREMLLRAAAQTWGVPREECEARQGLVRHAKTGRFLTYGQICEKAAKLPVPRNPPLKKESQFSFIGKPLPRLDVPEKVEGSAVFGIDIFLPAMLYAAIARPPAYGAKPLSYDREAAAKIPGVSRVVPIDGGIAVCAHSLEAARKGKEALAVKWGPGLQPDLNNETLEKSLIGHLAQKGVVAKDRGNAAKSLSEASRKIEATYFLPYLAHTTMEPMDCTAHVQRDRCDVWVPTQGQTGVLMAARKITGLQPEQIYIHTTFLGGGFGRRSEADVAEEALQISKAAGKPVKVIWTREEDIRYDFYRPGNCCRIEGALNEKGELTAWSHKVVCPSIFARFSPGSLKDGVDPAAVEGIANMEYEIPNLYVEYVRMDTPVPVGFWRSVGSSENAFTVESFMDEMARAAGKDPVEFRLNLLKNHPRIRRVIEMAAEKGGWGKSLKKGDGLGFAYHNSFGSRVAQVAEVSIQEKDEMIKVRRVVCAVDCGPAVNPAIIIAQMKSGINMGLSAALREKVEFSKGGVASTNFDNYEILRLKEAPEVEVHIVPSEEKIGGIGEPGLPPIAPAVANAVFQASGIRVRRLPMLPVISEGLKKKGG